MRCLTKNMILMLTLLKNDFRLLFKDWKAVILLLTAPGLFIAFFAYALSPYLNKSSFIEPFPIVIVDNEDTTQTRLLIKQLEDIEVFSSIEKMEYEAALEQVRQDKAGAAIIIPEDFTYNISVGINEPVTVIGNNSRPLQSLIVKNLMESAANIVSAGQSAINAIYHFNLEAGVKGAELEDQYVKSTTKVFLEAVARREIFSNVEAMQNFNLTPVEYFSSALIIVFLMFAGMPGMKMLVTERTQGITKRLSASPAKMWQVVLSKLTVSFVMSVLQFATVIVLTSIVFKNYWGAPVKSILLLFTAIIFAVSCWSVFVSSISTSQASADVIGNLGILLMAIVGGSIYPLSSMPEFTRVLSNITINRWAMSGFMILFSGNDALSVNGCVAPLVIIGTMLLSWSVLVLKLRRE